MLNNNEKIEVLFINGVGHSGSTLLDVLLNNHSQISGFGEIEKFGHKVIHPETVCSCGKDFIDCEFWGDYVSEHQNFLNKGVRQINKSKLDILSNSDKYYFLNYGDGETNKDEYLRENEFLYDYIKNKTSAKIILDSTKNPIRSDFLSDNSEFLKISVIHLVRDARGVMASYKKKYGRPMFYLWTWFTGNLKVLLLSRRSKINYKLMMYEDLVRDPGNVLADVFRWVGLENESVIENKNSVRHYVAGNERVYKQSDILISEDFRWKKELNIFEKIVGSVFNVILKILIKIL